MKTQYISFFLLLINSQFLFAHKKQASQPKPNIIFILVDDLGYGDVGAFFQKMRQERGDRSEPWMFTPELDKMAAEGAMLPQQHCAAPVCAPSRASIILGVNQGHANVRDNQFDKALEDNYTLGNVLQKAGYSTAAIGKWGLQGKAKAPNWPAHPLKRGFDYYFGYIGHGDGHEHYPKEGLYRGRKKVWENYTDVTAGLDKCYTGDLFTAAAKKYITDHQKGKEAGKPFFIYLAYDTPHAVLELPTQAYPAGGGLHGGLQWTGKPGHMINTASGRPDSYVYPEYAHATYDDDKNPATPEVPWPDTYKRYASVNHRIDEQVGDILQLLKDLKIDNNTLVVFTSDNGPSQESYLPKNYVKYEADFFNNFGPFDGIKRDCYEGGLRSSTIAWWPGSISPGTVVNTPNISYDWLPTFTNAAGLPAPVRSDGVSLLPALTKKGRQEDSRIYVEYFHPGMVPGYAEFSSGRRNKRRNQMQMLRFGDTVAVRYDIRSAGDDFEIYDVAKDPGQRRNLAPGNESLQQRLKAVALQGRMPDTTAARPYDNVLIPAVNTEQVRPGLHMESYEVNSTWIPATQNLKPVATATVNTLEPASVKGNMVFMEGFIQVPVDGAYTFYLETEGKAFLRIHDAAVIDADYGYQPHQLKTSTLRLKAGYHPIQIYCLAGKGNQKPNFQLQWSYDGSAIAHIPADSFCYQ